MLPRPRSCAPAALAALALAAPAPAQQPKPLSFSVDWHGPLKGTPSTGGVAITEGDVLFPLGGSAGFALGTPEIRFTGGFLGLVRYPVCVGTGPGTPCGVELDALSYGLDAPLPSSPDVSYRILFSVDEFAQGVLLPAPSIVSEAPLGDISGDVLVAEGLPPAPVPPATPPRHVAIIDGDGLPNVGPGLVYPGLGVGEPTDTLPGVPDPGDNLDAFDVGPIPDPDQESIYFSVDGVLFDVLEGVASSNTAGFQGVQPGDVLRRLPTGAVVVYATAAALGLDSAGPGLDDLDLLILWENGEDGFQAPGNPFDWEDHPSPVQPSDMLLFSVRRGSRVIGQIDSLQGITIVEGDILMPPVTGGNGNPGVLIAAEALGLRVTRGTMAMSDDSNAGDSEPDPYLDCNDNNVEDAIDIANGTSEDENQNGIPDECEPPGMRFCFCPAASAPCGNADANAGCANSTGFGADMTGSGSSSAFMDDLVLTSSGIPTNQFGLTFMGAGAFTGLPLGDGLRCVDSGGVGLFRYPVQFSGASGSFSLGPGIVSDACASFPAQGCIIIGSTWNFQTWYRDPAGPCGNFSNISNAVGVLFTP